MNAEQKQACVTAIKELYPAINWVRFEAIDTVLNFDLWYGTVFEYYPSAEDWPDGYVYPGLKQATKDLIEVLDPLPHEMWFDLDGEGCVTDTNPDDYDGYWNYTSVDGEHQLEYEFRNGKGRYFSIYDGKEYEPDLNRESIWVGGEWEKFDVRQVLMHDETWKQVF